MSLLTWNESFSIHNDLMDGQHKALLHLFNNLHKKCTDNDMDSLPAVMCKLQEYTKFHFQAEEEYMVEMRYKGIIMHKIEHRYFEKRVEEFTRHESDCTVDRVRLIIAFLSNWILRHILEEDKKISVGIIAA